ncbi:Protein F52A8.1 [Aphelenchoides avenae]|nr:Protein F52A8.1 [Aphelenchus avenae]
MKTATLAALVVVVTLASFGVSPATADILDDIKEMEPFRLRESSLACPLPLVGVQCPEANPIFYHKCCGELQGSCCFRLQDWVIVVLGIMTALVILSIFVNLIRCIFCY